MANLSRLYNIERVRDAARRTLPRVLFDYVDGDAEDGQTRRANHDGYAHLSLRPQVPSGGDKADLSVEVLGRTLSFPVIVAPCGLAAMVYPDGPICAARAAAARGTVSVLSTVAGTEPEALAAAVDDPGWFQLYAPGGREVADGLVERAQNCGFSALVVTTDTAVLGRRERDLSHGVSLPLHVDARFVARLVSQVAVRPVWLGRMARSQVVQRRAAAAHTAAPPTRPKVPGMGASPFTWDDIARIREQWEGPLVIKGLVTADDARRARDAGAQAVVVSNHGGRQLDGGPSTIAALPAVVDAVGGDIEVIVDGGIRRGTDVIKALASGARAVQIGRPWLYGLAAAGQPGIEHVLRLLRYEMRIALALMDVSSVRDLNHEHLI